MLRRADFGLFHHCWCCSDIKQGIAWLWLQVLWCWPCLSLLGPLFVTFSGIDLCHWCDVIAEARPSFCWCGNATNKWLSLRGPLFFRFTFPDWLLLNFYLLCHCFSMLWKASATLGTLLLLSGVSHFSSRVGAEALKLCKKPPPKKADSFPGFQGLPLSQKKWIQTANVA